jgi:hypothetical protein
VSLTMTGGTEASLRCASKAVGSSAGATYYVVSQEIWRRLRRYTIEPEHDVGCDRTFRGLWAWGGVWTPFGSAGRMHERSISNIQPEQDRRGHLRRSSPRFLTGKAQSSCRRVVQRDFSGCEVSSFPGGAFKAHVRRGYSPGRLRQSRAGRRC